MNEVAAASYLNIDPIVFSKPEIQAHFKAAIYSGPFSSEADPFWWRSDIDNFLVKTGAKNGNEYLAKKTGKKIPICSCSVNKKREAGYYCMMTRKPISYEESRGNISWFPQGASLARVNKDIFDELAPWIGLY